MKRCARIHVILFSEAKVDQDRHVLLRKEDVCRSGMGVMTERANGEMRLLDVVMNYTPSMQEFNAGKQKVEPITGFSLVHFYRNEGRKIGPAKVNSHVRKHDPPIAIVVTRRVIDAHVGATHC
jgi:hypothetical protein